jgi:hypothetical protein
MSSALSVAPLLLHDTGVSPTRTRRQFTATYKLQILAAADACTKPGELGALLRREGLYSSHLAVAAESDSSSSPTRTFLSPTTMTVMSGSASATSTAPIGGASMEWFAAQCCEPVGADDGAIWHRSTLFRLDGGSDSAAPARTHGQRWPNLRGGQPRRDVPPVCPTVATLLLDELHDTGGPVIGPSGHPILEPQRRPLG